MSSPALRTALCIRELGDTPDAMAALGQLRSEPYPWLLDSALVTPPRGAGALGRYSFAGADPYLVLRAFGDRVELDCRRSVRADLVPGCSVIEHDPLEVARSLMPPPLTREAGAALPFVGGAVGYWGYELAQQVESIELHARDDLGLPDMVLLYVDRLLAIDHVTGRSYCVGLGFASDRVSAGWKARDAADALAQDLSFVCAPQAPPLSGDALEGEAGGSANRARTLTTHAPLPEGLQAGFDLGDYTKAVSRVLDEIEAGNVYQANLTRRLQHRFEGDVVTLYEALRRVNPAPFGAFLGLPEVSILSSSPERFLRVDRSGRVESRPIKGTRPRGSDELEDARLAEELANSSKDRAENVMIVDLVRNDLGRVCEIGSVETSELMSVEPYAGVFQMVSTVSGKLPKNRDVTDLLRAAFPPGSMTGTPKIAAMRIIDALEPVRRSVYSGAIGYLDARGGADLSVVIRTLLVADGYAYVHAGGGVVADSDPIAEHREAMDKARPLLAALALAGATG
jgi:para-aminobenzoate synthetase component 1